MVRSAPLKLLAGVSICLPAHTACLEDRSALVQGPVQVRRQVAEPADAVRQAVSALDPFTIVGQTSLHRLPGASDQAWGSDSTKSFGGVLISDGPKQSVLGAMGGSDALQGTSHGIYGGGSSDQPGKPLFAGAWQSTPGGLKVAHATPTADGGLDVSHTEHTYGSLPPGPWVDKLLAPVTLASLPAGVPTSPTAAAAPPVPQEAPEDPRLELANISEIVKQPFSADGLAVAFRKPGAEKGPAWNKDDVLAVGGQLVSTGPVKGGMGGVGGFSTQDQSYHMLYGSGVLTGFTGLGSVSGGAVGTVVGKPGQMDLTHLQPTLDGGADVTSLHAQTQHVGSEELHRLLTAGNFTWPGLPQQAGGATPAAPSSPAQPPATPGVPTPAEPWAPWAGSPATPGTEEPASGQAPSAPAAPTPVDGGDDGEAGFEPALPVGETEPPEQAWGSITERLGDIGDAVEQGKLADIVPESWATSTAARVATVIAKAFSPLKGMAELLLQEVLRVKSSLFKVLGMASHGSSMMKKKSKAERRHKQKQRNNNYVDPIVAEFEAAFYRGIQTVLDRWHSLHATFLSAAANLTAGLSRGNQTALARMVNRSLSASDAALSDFAEHLQNAVAEVPGFSSLTPQQIGVVLNKTNAELYEALRSLTAFGPVAFGRPVQDLVDKVSDALSTVGISPERVRRSFGFVEHMTTSVQWRVRGAGRELLLGAHQAIVAVTERLDVPEPGWPPAGVEPVVEPLTEGAQAGPWWASWFGAASGPKGPGALLWLSISALLAASL